MVTAHGTHLESIFHPQSRAQSDSLRTERRQRAEEQAAKTTIKMVPPLVIFVNERKRVPVGLTARSSLRRKLTSKSGKAREMCNTIDDKVLPVATDDGSVTDFDASNIGDCIECSSRKDTRL